MSKRILVDMSLTLIHHGHIRILKKASKLGQVIVALTTDEEIFKTKGFYPTLSFENRKEIALAFKYIEQVIESVWSIAQQYLNDNNIDLLVHGDDNKNPTAADRLVIFERIEELSSAMLRTSNKGLS